MRSVTVVSFICFILVAGSVSAATVWEYPFMPSSPEVLAQGGSFVANAQGYNSLFSNPAAFAVQAQDSITILGTTIWLYANPANFIASMQSDDPADLVGFLEDQITTGGFGFGFSEGIAYVANGFGFGLVLNVDSYLHGATTLGASGDLHATVGFVGGYAFPINFFGLTMLVGADLRPMIRIRAPIGFDVVVDMMSAIQTDGDPLAALNASNALHGFGLGFDLGAILELGDLKVGLVVRDVPGTWFSYNQNTFGEIVTSLGETFWLPKDGTTPSDTYLIPLDVSVGVAYHFDLGSVSRFIDPTIHASLADVVGVIRDGRSIWTLLHVGAEVKVLSFIQLMGGLNQGYLTAGIGLDLFFLDLTVAMFTREMGIHLGDQPNSGVAAELSLRF